jgi:hypothetical protein
MQFTRLQEDVQASSSPTPVVRKKMPFNLSIAIRMFVILSGIVLPAILSQGAEAHVQTTVANAPKSSAGQSTFQKGIIYPRYSPYAYGSGDLVWQNSVPTMKTQTAAQWIEMPVLFDQATSAATTVVGGQSTPSVASFAYGVKTAHAQGLHVFLVPLMSVDAVGGWAGTITEKSQKDQQAWFDSYWNMFKPYVQAAADNNVEQISIATEMELQERAASPVLWNQLITRIRSIYSKSLTYDMNFSTLSQPLPSWFNNPNLAMIGVSSYFQLVSTSTHIAPSAMVALWRNGAKSKLDAFAKSIGKPVLISEIGYRDSSDALYQPWAGTSQAAVDPQEQAGAYDAALSNIMTDPSIGGVFAWGWDDVHELSIKDQPAAQVIHKWYTASL